MNELRAAILKAIEYADKGETAAMGIDGGQAATFACIVDVLRAALAQQAPRTRLKDIDIETIEAVADEIGVEFKHSARAGSLRVVARQIRAARERAQAGPSGESSDGR